MSRWLKNLNPEQRQAVEAIHGPLLVLAGAGSGKTRVITHRIAHMMDQGIAPESILGVTFTNKAAGEMRERLAAMVGSGRAAKVTLNTFHALGLSILRAEAARRRRSQRVAIFDTGDQLACLREICARVRMDRAMDLGSILARISAWKNDFVTPSPDSLGDDEYDQAAAVLMPYYQEQLEAYSAVDFDDLVCRPCQLMERSESCRQRWAGRYAYVLVDEYQDTNGSQLRLLRAIAGEHRNLCVVGDDDQSIYGWRGAQVKNILRFDKDFPGAKVVHLSRNYRSVGAVLDLANHVIAQNPERHEKHMVAVREPGPAVRLQIFADGDAEARWIAAHIRDALKRGLRGRDIAVLYRSNLFSRDLEVELRTEGIPYRVLGGTAFFDSKEIKDLLAYLRICAHPGDEIALRRVINSPPRGIGPRTVATLGGWADKSGASFYKALRQADQILGPGNRQAGAVAGFVALIDRARKRFRDGRQLAQGARELVRELELEQAIARSTTNIKAVDKRLARLHGLVDGLRQYCERAPRPSLQDYVNRITLESSDPDLEDLAGDLVTLSSLHGSKGLEFRLVVLAGVEEGYLPHERTLNPRQSDVDVGDIAEERRLCYVGITRAMDELVLTRCKERLVRGKLQPRTPSRFLDGVGEELLAVDDQCRPVSNDQVQSMVADLLAKLEG